MKKTYRNKRDQYKAEAELHLEKAKAAEQEAKRLREHVRKQEEEKKQWWSATVFCRNCLCVRDISAPPGMKISEGGCVECRVLGMLEIVRDYPGKGR